jgi:plasmid stabilization system protein ParE
MSDYALTALAKTDIFDIWSYIAEQNENAANRVEHAIYDARAFLADVPLARSPSARPHAAPRGGRVPNRWKATGTPSDSCCGSCSRQQEKHPQRFIHSIWTLRLSCVSWITWSAKETISHNRATYG